MHIPFLRPKSASISSAGPLSVGVPLEGTDTVPGLRALERRAAAEGIARLLRVAAANGFAPGRKYTRYRGPYLDQLSLESLKAAPKKWSEFFGVERWRRRRNAKEKTDADADSDKKPPSSSSSSSASSSSSSSSSSPPPPPPSWTLPTSVLALRERAEENVVAFLPNYLRAVAVLVVALAALGGRPLSLVGLACLAAFAVANARGMLGGPSVSEAIARKQQQLMLEQQTAAAAAGGQQTPQGASAAQPAVEEPTPPARAAATVFVYGVAAYTRAFAPLTRGIALGVALAALHACLRVAATERAAWATAAATAATSSSSSGEQQQRQRQRRLSLPYSVAGVPFRDVFFGGGASSSSSSSSSSSEEDPRRCLRELAAAARALASAAAIGAKAGAVAAFDAAVAKAKALRQQLR